MKQVSLIIPAYNEEARIRNTVINYDKHLGRKFKDYEIIVALNGCRDNTLGVVKELQSKINKLKFVNFEEKIGKGGAIIEGMKYSEGEIIGFVDADDAFDIRGIISLIESVRENVDCAIASKWKNQRFRDIDEPFMRKAASRGWNFLVWTVLGINYMDTQAGAKFFKRKVMDKIGFNFASRDFTFDAELLYKIKNNKFKIREIFVSSKHVQGSTFKLRYSINMLLKLIKIWWSK